MFETSIFKEMLEVKMLLDNSICFENGGLGYFFLLGGLELMSRDR